MNPILGVKIIDYALAALGLLPSLFVQVRALLGLRDRLERGEQVTAEELDALLTDIDTRSKRIQQA